MSLVMGVATSMTILGSARMPATAAGSLRSRARFPPMSYWLASSSSLPARALDVQDVLADDEWAAQLTDAHRRGLTPLFWTHVALYGEVKLDMSSRLALASAPHRP